MLLSGRSLKADVSSTSLFGYRGINISLNHDPKPEDLAKIKNWGANLIRFVLNTDPKTETPAQYDGKKGSVFNADNKTLSPEYLARIDAVVAMAKENGIKVIIDMHTFPGHADGLVWGNKQYWDELVEIWKDIAVHFKDNDTVLGFDPVNEPNILDSLKPGVDPSRVEVAKQMTAGEWTFPKEWRNTPRDYYQLMMTIATSVNAIDPSKMIFVEGFGLLGNPVNYHWMEPISAKNIVYSFHFYVPHNFSHNGINGSKVSDASYASAKKGRLEDAISPVLAFAKAHQATFFVGEIGLSPYTEGHGAGAWLTDAIGMFEANQWPWAYWAYSFPTMSPEYGVVDGKIVNVGTGERMQTLKKFWSADAGR
jgi:endoglucanase